jgi:hypothetical protein
MRVGMGQIFDRPPGFRGKRFEVVPYPLGLAFEELAGILEQNPALPQVTPKSPARKEPVQMAFEDNAVEGADRVLY